MVLGQRYRTMTPFDQSEDVWTSTEISPVYAEEDQDENGVSMLRDGTYCSVKWDDLWSLYNPHVHYPLLLFICIVGCVANILNLFIFTRPAMQNPTNLLLSVLAVTDLLCVSRKAVDVSMTFLRQDVDERTSYQKKVENWIHKVCFYLFHTWSIYMTVAVALWRLLGILRPMQSRHWLSYKSATLVAATSVGFSTLLVPLLFVGTAIELQNSEPQYDDYPSNSSMNMNDSSLDTLESNIVDPDYVLTQPIFGQMLQFWIHGLLIKLGPCVILIVSTILLIMSLRVATKNRLALFEDQNLKSAPKQSNAKNPNRTRNNDSQDGDVRDAAQPNHSATATKEFIKTTKMAFCFGLIKEKKFFLQCYIPVRPFLNLNEYISSSAGFFIYFQMSSKFRQTFVQHFWISKRTSDANSTFFNKFSPIVRLLSCKGDDEQEAVSNETKSSTTKPSLAVGVLLSTNTKIE